jgi:peptidoglycan hydrolase CwlO-like protein
MSFLGLKISIVETEQLDRIEQKVNQLLKGQQKMAGELDTLTASVSNATTVEQSAIDLINGLAAQIASLKNDPAALQALSDSLNAKSADLAAAVTANTPAAPTP